MNEARLELAVGLQDNTKAGMASISATLKALAENLRSTTGQLNQIVQPITKATDVLRGAGLDKAAEHLNKIAAASKEVAVAFGGQVRAISDGSFTQRKAIEAVGGALTGLKAAMADLKTITSLLPRMPMSDHSIIAVSDALGKVSAAFKGSLEQWQRWIGLTESAAAASRKWAADTTAAMKWVTDQQRIAAARPTVGRSPMWDWLAVEESRSANRMRYATSGPGSRDDDAARMGREATARMKDLAQQMDRVDKGLPAIAAGFRSVGGGVRRAAEDVHSFNTRMSYAAIIFRRIITYAIEFQAMRWAGSLVTEGLKFNQMLEDTKFGIAGVLLATREYQTAKGGELTLQRQINAALDNASYLQVQLKRDALETAATYEQLVTAFNTAIGPATRAGVSDPGKIREIVKQATQAMAQLRIPLWQSQQEVRAMFEGTTRVNDRLNQVLRITTAEIKKVRDAGGDVSKLFLERLAPFAAMATRGLETLTVAASNLKDKFQQVSGAAMAPLFDVLKSVAAGGGAVVDKAAMPMGRLGDALGQTLLEIQPAIGSFVMTVVSLAGAFAKVGEALAKTGLTTVIGKLLDVFSQLVNTPWGPWLLGATMLAKMLPLMGRGMVGLTGTLLGMVGGLGKWREMTLLSVIATDRLRSALGIAAMEGGKITAMAVNASAAARLLTQDVAYLWTTLSLAGRVVAGVVGALAALKLGWDLAHLGDKGAEYKRQLDENEVAELLGIANIGVTLNALQKSLRKEIANTLDPVAKTQFVDLLQKVNAAKAKWAGLQTPTEGLFGAQTRASTEAINDFKTELVSLQRTLTTRSVFKQIAEDAAEAAKELSPLDKLLKQLREDSAKKAATTATTDALAKAETEGAKILVRQAGEIAAVQQAAKAAHREFVESGAQLAKSSAEQFADARLLWRALLENVDVTTSEIRSKTRLGAVEAAEGFVGELAGLRVDIERELGDANGVTQDEIDTMTKNLWRIAEKVRDMRAVLAVYAPEILAQLEKMLHVNQMLIPPEPTAKVSTKGADAETEAAKILESTLSAERKAYRDHIDRLLGEHGGLVAGMEAGWYAIAMYAKDSTEVAYDFVTKTWDDMGRAFDETFYFALTNRFESIKDAFKNLWDSILKSFSTMLGQMAQKWLSARIAPGLSGAFTGVSLPPAVTYGAQGQVNTAASGTQLGSPAWGYLGAAAGGLGIGSMIGGGGTGNMVGGAIGGIGGAAAAAGGALAGLGLELGVWAGPVGAIVGAILGAIIGGLFNKNTEKFVGINGSTILGNVPTSEMGANVLNQIGTTQSGVGDILRKTEAGKTSGFLMGPLIQDYIAKFNTIVGAGSKEDLQKDLEYVYSRQVPREVLHTLFGQKEAGRYGEDDARSPWGAEGAIKEWGDVSESGPIYTMLASLRVLPNKIREIAALIDVKDPEKFLEYLSNFVDVLVTTDKLTAAFAKSRTQVWADIKAEGEKTPVDELLDATQVLKQQFGEIALYTGDQQIAKAKELLDTVNQRWESELEYLRKIYALQQQAITATAEATRGITGGFYKETSDQTAARLATEAADAFGAIGGAKTPEKAADAFNKLEGLFDNAVTYFVQLWQRAKELQVSVDETRGKFGTPFSKTLGQATGLRKIQEDAVDLAFAQARAAELSGAKQLDAIQKINEKAGEMYDAQLSMMQALADNAKALDESIAQFRWDIQYEMAGQYGNAPGSRIGMIKGEVEKLMTGIGTANTPEALAGATSQIQSLLKTYWQMFAEDDPRRKDAALWVNKVLDDLAKAAGDRTTAMQAELEGTRKSTEEILGKTSALLGVAMANATASMDAWVVSLEAGKEKLVQVTNGVADLVLDTNQTIAALIAALRGMITTTPNAPGIPGGGGNIETGPPGKPPTTGAGKPADEYLDGPLAAFGAALATYGTVVADLSLKTQTATVWIENAGRQAQALGHKLSPYTGQPLAQGIDYMTSFMWSTFGFEDGPGAAMKTGLADLAYYADSAQAVFGQFAMNTTQANNALFNIGRPGDGALPMFTTALETGVAAAGRFSSALDALSARIATIAPSSGLSLGGITYVPPRTD